MDSCSLPLTVSALAVAIAQNLDDEELALISSLFVLLGDTLATIGAQRACKEKIILPPFN